MGILSGLSSVVTPFFYFILIFGILTLIFEKCLHPILIQYRKKMNKRKFQFKEDVTEFDNERKSTLQKTQTEWSEQAKTNKKEHDIREIERKEWILQDKIRRSGIKMGRKLGTGELEGTRTTVMEKVSKLKDPSATSKLLKEQDIEFQKHLKIDQRKEKEKSEEEERKRKQIELNEKRIKNLPKEPLESDPNSIRVAIRLPNGKKK